MTDKGIMLPDRLRAFFRNRRPYLYLKKTKQNTHAHTHTKQRQLMSRLRKN